MTSYAFEASTIKLNQRDLDRWRKAFPHISLEAELWALDDWAKRQPNWFVAVSGALAKRNREAMRPAPKRAELDDPLGNPI